MLTCQISVNFSFFATAQQVWHFNNNNKKIMLYSILLLLFIQLQYAFAGDTHEVDAIIHGWRIWAWNVRFWQVSYLQYKRVPGSNLCLLKVHMGLDFGMYDGKYTYLVPYGLSATMNVFSARLDCHTFFLGTFLPQQQLHWQSRHTIRLQCNIIFQA